jgi:predicted AlkP superfamily phosphohydrolase/phosphomutase
VLVSGFVSPVLEKSVYPKNYLKVLKKLNYKSDVKSEKAHTNMDSFTEDLFSTLKSHIELYRYLWKKEKWDIFMFVFTGTDRLMHFLWQAYVDEAHKYHPVFLEYFEQIDEVIGEIHGNLKNDDIFLMFSDHGFEKLDKDVYINRLLQKNDFLKLNNSYEINSINTQTGVFALDPARIYINLEGKYPQGGVKPEEREGWIERLEDLFNSLEADGKKVINKIYRKEAIYSGRYLDFAPDLVLLSNSGFNLRASLSSQEIVSKSIFTGKHTYYDAFLLAKDSRDRVKPNYSEIDRIEDIITKIGLNHE